MSEKHAGGRPTKYNEEIAAFICEKVATHTCGLQKLCEMYDEFPSKFTVNLWRVKHEEFSVLYAQAKLRQADLLTEECLDIADETSRDTYYTVDGDERCDTEWVARSRLRIDTRKWLASKLLPKQYGPHADNNKSVSDTIVEKLIDKLVD